MDKKFKKQSTDVGKQNGAKVLNSDSMPPTVDLPGPSARENDSVAPIEELHDKGNIAANSGDKELVGEPESTEE